MTKITTWTGNAAGTYQTNTWTFAGTWEATDIVNVTINGKTVAVVAGSTVANTVVNNVVTALSAITTPEFLELTFTNAGSAVLTGTAISAGIPFTCTLTSTETDGGNADGQTIDGVATSTLSSTGSTGVVTTTCTGPNFLDNALNWDNGLPADGDTVVFANSKISALYGGANGAVTPALIYFYNSFIGEFGLPLTNSQGANSGSYTEYRQRYPQYGGSGDSTTMKIYIGVGPGAGSSRIQLDASDCPCTIIVYNTDKPANGEEVSFFFKGTATANSLSVLKGFVGVAYYPEETSALTSPTTSFISNQENDVYLVLGPGVTITTGMNLLGGTVTTKSNIGTVEVNGATLIVNEAATSTALNIDAGDVIWRSTGTITALKIGDGGKFDNSQNAIGATITTPTLNKGATLLDPLRTLTFTNPLILNRCGLQDVTLDLGPHITLQRALGS